MRNCVILRHAPFCYLIAFPYTGRPLKRGRPNHVTTGLSRVVVPVISPAAAADTDHHNSVSSVDSLLPSSHNGK